MTCIVGCIDKRTNSVWMGADSLGSNGFIKVSESMPKIFRHQFFENVIIGSTTTFRHIDLLKYSKDILPEIDWYKKTEITHEYMVTKFIPELIKLFNDGIISEKAEEKGANFLIGINNNLFEIQSDYSVLCPRDGFTAVGCGEYHAVASMITTKDMDMTVRERIEKALYVAEYSTCGVQRPFKLLNTIDKEEIIIT